MSDDKEHGAGLPKFVVIGLGAIGLIVLGVKVGLPMLASGTCATLDWGCSVPAKLTGGSQFTAGASPSIRLPSRGSQEAEHHWTNNGANSQCDGRPKNVPFTCVSPTSGLTVSCVCK